MNSRLPLVAGPSYAPFILNGSHERHQRGPRDRLAADWYQLWVLRAGTWEIHGCGRDSLQHAPGGLLVAPRAKLRLTVHGKTDRLFLEFDVVRQRRVHRKPGASSLRHADDQRRQPCPREVWGVDLPAIIPAPLVDGCIQMTAFCCVNWWRDPLHHARANARLADWLAGYLISQAQPDQTPAATWLEECQRLARQRLHTCLNVEEWAALMNLSRQHFSARFAREAGATPHEYLSQLRAEQAQRMLTDTSLSVQAIAAHTGFRSLETFSRFFRQQTAYSPRQWRYRNRPSR
jgi:AraC-like DNA-binding protein